MNTTTYHPQWDGLVEGFNWSLADMLSKTASESGQDRDEKLCYLHIELLSNSQLLSRHSF